MIREHGNLIGWSSLLAVALVAAACSDQTRLNTAPRRPSFWQGGASGCTVGKWTGGGRIDPPNNHDMADEEFGGQPKYPAAAPITGKVTFGFNVFLALDGGGNCVVSKGEIEVNGHVAKIAWHVSIHDGIDAFSGQRVFATTFSDGHTGGECLVVGLPGTPPYMIARVNPGDGREMVQFEVCDNDRGAPQNSRTDAMRWRTENKENEGGDTGLTYLTGGNVVDHTS